MPDDQGVLARTLATGVDRWRNEGLELSARMRSKEITLITDKGLQEAVLRYRAEEGCQQFTIK